MWPMVLDITRDECKRMLRRYELEAYSSVVTALRAQGDLSKDKKKVLQDLSSLLSISLERHRAEVRRAVNDERLNTIAQNMSSSNTSTEWTIEGRRLIPLLPRLVPQTAFTGLANNAATDQLSRNQIMLSPSETGTKQQIETNQVLDDNLVTTTHKRRRIESQSQSQFVPIKTNSICEPIVVQNPPSLGSNHRSPHSISSRTVVNASNCYTVSTTLSPQSVGQSGARVIFVSAPTTSPSNVNTTTKGVTAIPLISRHTLGSPQKPVIDIPNTRAVKQKPGRPPAVNASIVGLIGVPGNQKQAKTVSNKTINPTNVSLASNVTRIPFISGTQVFTKTNGQQQVVVFPVNSRQPVSIAQTVKAISIPSSSPSVTTVTTTAPTLIYQSGSGVKSVARGQGHNLIIMQQKPNINTFKPLSSTPTTAITLSKANIAKTQVKSQIFPHKKQVVDIGPNPANQTLRFNLSDNPKIITKRIQTSPKSIQEINVSLPQLAQRGIVEIDASNDALSGLFRSGLTPTDFMEFIRKSNSSNAGQQLTETHYQREEIHDSSSEDTVSTSESPLHEMQSDFGEISDSVCTESVKTLLDKQ